MQKEIAVAACHVCNQSMLLNVIFSGGFKSERIFVIKDTVSKQ